jgi:hypothetical protein
MLDRQKQYHTSHWNRGRIKLTGLIVDGLLG